MSEDALRRRGTLPESPASSSLVQAYLQRIGLAQEAAPDYAWLARLQRAHLETVPFENLSVTWGEPILLDEARLHAKIVAGGRGGFCYELNGLFAWLLRQLGFAVTRLAAQVYNAEQGAFGPPFDHMTLLVHLEGDYLVDVGFGDSFRQPLLLPDGAVAGIEGHYRLQPPAPGERRFLLQKRARTGWEPQYRFDLQPRELGEYAGMCAYHQSSPQSPFTRGPFCTRATPEGRITLSAHSLTISQDGQRQKKAVPSPAHFREHLRQFFAMDV